MKSQFVRFLTVLALCASLHQAAAQGTAFMYQGQLSSSNAPANGLYDFQFTLSNAPSGGARVGSMITQTAIGVTNGLFGATLDFGPVFTGNDTWLGIAVRSNGVGSYLHLTPLQELTPTPYSVFANTASNLAGALPSGGLSGLYGDPVTLNNAANVFAGNGNGLTGLNAANLTGTLADALLPADVALLDAPNQSFTGTNHFTGAGHSFIVNSGPISTNLFTGLGLQYDPGSGEGAFQSSFNDGYASLSFYTKAGSGLPVAKQVQINRYGVLALDLQDANDGTINDGTTNGTGLTFGTSSGEGIASQRMPGVNQYGLDFYTSSSHRMSILHNGNVGIGTTNPGTALQVNGTVTAAAFSGNGAGLTNVPGASLILNPGTLNFFAGQSAGNPTMTGTYNTGVGDGVLSANSTGDYNTATGVNALSANTSGGNNTALGVYALWQNTNGGGNTALGADALAYNTSGGDNTATGLGALENNLSSDNTAVGANVLNANQNGFQNTGIGYGALTDNTSGDYNTAAGAGALGNNNGSYNAAFGAGALGLTSSGSDNLAAGADALAFNGTGSNNTATGYAALALNTTGNNNTADGYNAMGGAFSSSSGNTALGGYALYETTTSYNNTAAGYSALEDDSTGVDNVGIGVSTFQNNSTGSGNTACGTYAFQNMTVGAGNIGLGMYAGYSLSAGSNNIYIGNQGSANENNVTRIGQGQTETYISGSIQLDGVDTNNGITYVPSGLPGISAGNGPFLFGYNGGALGGLFPTTVCLSWDFSGDVWVSNNLSTLSLTIRGGSDLAEPFKITPTKNEDPQGAVMVIDEEHPGQLKVSSQAYDTHVAGVLSGANGIHPGIQMQQEGLLDGGKNVALTGRVYVQADASNGPIRPGDLLTTSGEPGRAMKVTDHLRAQGAILGKAMTGLSEGQGMVLVLVTLQ